MKTIYILQMYILKELLKTLCLSLVVVTSILFMAMLLQLVSKLQVIDITNFVDFLPNLVLYILGYTLPLSLLVSTNLTWGKFSSDNEITAMKACGISPLHLLSPFLFVSLYISLISYYLNDQIIPQSHLQKRQLMHHAIHQILNSTASHGGATIELINDLRISYFRYKDGVFHGLLIHRLDNGQAQEKWVGAQGKMFFDGQSLILKLKNRSFVS
jgi:lipopolysaccharide export LptBFGC system permease protein LptF